MERAITQCIDCKIPLVDDLQALSDRWACFSNAAQPFAYVIWWPESGLFHFCCDWCRTNGRRVVVKGWLKKRHQWPKCTLKFLFLFFIGIFYIFGLETSTRPVGNMRRCCALDDIQQNTVLPDSPSALWEFLRRSTRLRDLQISYYFLKSYKLELGKSLE